MWGVKFSGGVWIWKKEKPSLALESTIFQNFPGDSEESILQGGRRKIQGGLSPHRSYGFGITDLTIIVDLNLALVSLQCERSKSAREQASGKCLEKYREEKRF